MAPTVEASYIRLCTNGHLTNQLSEDTFFGDAEKIDQLVKRWNKPCKYCSSLEGTVRPMSKDQLGEPLKFEEIKISGRSKKVPVFDINTRL